MTKAVLVALCVVAIGHAIAGPVVITDGPSLAPDFAEDDQDAPHIIPLRRIHTPDHGRVTWRKLEGEDAEFDLMNRTVALLANHKTTQYVGPIFLGHPQQKIDVIWDTGSSNTWVYAQSCKTEVCKSHQRYNRAASSTYKPNGKGMVIKYGSGDIEGVLSQDTLSFCTEGDSCRAFSEKAVFGEVSWTTGESFLWGQYSGIVGLGFPSLAIDGTTPPFDAMFLEGRFANPVFAFHLTKKPNEPGSALSVGGVQRDKFKGNMQWHNLFVKDKTPEYWTLKLDDVLVDGQSMGLCQPHGCPVAVDTGTSLITGPSRMINKLIPKIDVDPECRNYDPSKQTLPVITMVIDGINYPLDQTDYVIHVEDGGQKLCLGGFRDLDLPPEKGPLWIAGDVFLRRYYSVYDRNSLKVGLAEAV